MMFPIESFLMFARHQADLARRVIDEKSNSVTIERKTDNSLVTNIDREIETMVRENIKQAFVGHGVLGEEYGDVEAKSTYQWIVDPIDGTQEFCHGSPLYGFILGLYCDNNPIVGLIDHPGLDIRCAAALGLGTTINGSPMSFTGRLSQPTSIVIPAREDFHKYSDDDFIFEKITKDYPNYRVYRSCYGHTSTLLGHTALTIEHDVHLWDISATRILIEEASGSFRVLRNKTNPNGDIVYSVVFGITSVVEKVFNVLGPLYDETLNHS